MTKLSEQEHFQPEAAGPEQSGDSGRFEGESAGADGRDHGVSTGPLELIRLTIDLTREADTPNQWTSHCVDLDIFSAGRTPERALEAVAEAVRMVVDWCCSHACDANGHAAMTRIVSEVAERKTKIADGLAQIESLARKAAPMIFLSDLKSLRAAMTQGEWERIGYTLVSPEFDVGRCDSPSDTTGIVATHNAADVLIEIAEAALAYEQAKLDAAVVRFALRNNATDEDCRRIEAHDNDEIRCHDAYKAALAKIKP